MAISDNALGDWSRRSFLGTAAALPFLIGGCCGLGVSPAVRRPRPSDWVTLAIIGCGTMGRGNMQAFLQDKRVQVVAVCDPVTEVKDHGYSPKSRGWGGRIAFRRIVDSHYGTKSCRACEDFCEIVDDPTIDAICVTTPGHWHALKKWQEKKDLGPNEQHLYRAADGHNHESDFIDGIYENRPIATDCEIGHRSISACHIANIAERQGVTKLSWDPVGERFTGADSDDANALLEVTYTNGWSMA